VHYFFFLSFVQSTLTGRFQSDRCAIKKSAKPKFAQVYICLFTRQHSGDCFSSPRTDSETVPTKSSRNMNETLLLNSIGAGSQDNKFPSVKEIQPKMEKLLSVWISRLREKKTRIQFNTGDWPLNHYRITIVVPAVLASINHFCH
jgi:hypothetical protein